MKENMAATVLYADRRPGGDDVYHPAAGAGTVRDLCAGPENSQVGAQGKGACAGATHQHRFA